MRRQVLVCGLVALLLGCSRGGGGSDRGGRAGGADTPTAVAVEPAARGIVIARYATTATLEAENRAEILSQSTGVITRIRAEEGDVVRQGEELLKLDDAAAQLKLRQAEAEVAEQESIFKRQNEGVQQDVVTRAEFDLASANLEAARIVRDLAAHELSLTLVQAPFTGTIVKRLVDVGETASLGMPLFEIANFMPLLARVHVPAKEFGKLRVGQDVDLRLDTDSQHLRGSVHLISPVVDATTGTIKVTVKVDAYPPGTRAGDFVHVSIVTERHENVIRVPNLAVFDDRGEQVVFVAQDSVGVRRPVQVGFIDDTHTEIVGGIAENELVIVKGQRSLRDNGAIRILEGGEGNATEARNSQARESGS